jgi:hypothetical protein
MASNQNAVIKHIATDGANSERDKTMADTKYNGWTNYETWLVALWIDNSEGDQEATREMAAAAYRDAEADDTFSRLERATLNLADQIKTMIEEAAPDLGASMYADMINGALSSVNWYEIAEHYHDDMTENEG